MTANTPLYSKKDFEIIFQNEKKYFNNDFNISTIAIDSREVIPNACFFAIRGKINDGHKYLQFVIDSGATCIICEYVTKALAKYLNEKTINVIIVDDTQKALIKLAQYRRNQVNGRIIAVTGSIGKTTTKENIADILSIFYPNEVYRSPKSYNTLLSTPAVLANMPLNTKVAVFEVSMSEPNNQIAFLSKIIKPDIACITTIAPAHAMNFETIDEICDQKCQIAAGLNPEKGVLILNQTSGFYDKMLNQAKQKYNIKNILNLGTENSHIYIKNYEFTEYFRTNFTIETNFASKKEEFSANVPGCSYHSAFNTLFAIAVVKLLSLDLKIATDQIKFLKTIEGRGNLEKIKTENVEIYIINESYNSSPEALKAAINSFSVLGNFKKNYKKIAILGDMLELGKMSENFHLSIIDNMINAKIDLFIAVGTMMAKVADKLSDEIQVLKYETANELVKDIRKILFFGKNLEKSLQDNNLIILLKGSNSINLSYVKNKLYR